MESWTQADEQEFQRMAAKREEAAHIQVLQDVMDSMGLVASVWAKDFISHAEALRFALAPYDPTVPKVGGR